MTSLEKAERLLKEMTLTEKVGQLVMKGGCVLNDQGVPENLDTVKMIEEGRIGSIIIHANNMIADVEYLQRIATTKSRLKIPLLINADMIHGLETVYPVPIACACSFDTQLVEKCAKAQAEETVICGIRYTNAPMVDISRDPRWGRIVESQGEDTYLAGEMAKAYVKGFQNDEYYVMATLKHFAGYGACEGGRDYNVCEMSENTMLNTYLIPFREGVKAGADSVMTAFNSIENIPATANKKYLKDILRDKFNFKGITLSDAISAYEMIPYGYCEDLKECALKSISAGLDVDLGSDVYPFELENLVKEGLVEERLIDEAVLRVLKKKYDLGLFDNPYPLKENQDRIMCNEFLDLSYQMGVESVVLLENNGILPINNSKKILLVGKFSSSHDLLGCWQESHYKNESVTLKQGLKNANMNITNVVDCYDVEKVKGYLSDADIVLFNFGETGEENGEAHSHHNLHINSEVVDCFNYIKSQNKKIVSLVMSARPLILNEILSSDAILMCWTLGHKTGDVIANLLCGKENFSAKLCVSIPKDEGQIPVYYAQKKLGRPYQPNNKEWRFQSRYDDGFNGPQYVFGYGLSYSTFEYSNLTLSSNVYTNDNITVCIDVENTSDVDGVEIVQLYVNDIKAEIIRPIKELKDFKRVYLKKHEKKTVSFVIDEEKLKYYHADGKYYADSGEFEVLVGKNSSENSKALFRLIK